MGSRRKTLIVALVVMAVTTGILFVLGVFNPPPGGGPWRPTGGEDLLYEICWNGVPCGEFRMGLTQEGKGAGRVLVLRFRSKTSENIRWIWRYQSEGSCRLDPETLLPTSSERTNISGKRVKRITTAFDREQGIAETVTEKLDKNKRSVDRTPFTLGVDLPSVLVYLRGLDLVAGRETELEMIEGDKVYSILLTPGEAEEIEVKAGRFSAQAVGVKARLIAGGDEEDEEDERAAEYRNIRCWISGRERLPVKIAADAVVGSLTFELVSRREGGP
jgi:hypothetical protein